MSGRTNFTMTACSDGEAGMFDKAAKHKIIKPINTLQEF